VLDVPPVGSTNSSNAVKDKELARAEKCSNNVDDEVCK